MRRVFRRLDERTGRRGFTLLEMLIAFGIGTTLTVVIYFFYMGLVHTGTKTKERLFLNQVAEIELERLVRELQLAVEFTRLAKDEVSFRRPQVRRWGGSGYEVNMDLSTRSFQTVTYRRVPVDKGRRVQFQRVLGLDAPEVLFEVEELEPEIFQGWVFPRGAEEEPHKVPEMEVYRHNRDRKSDLERIPLVKICFAMKNGKDRIEIQTKAFVPPVYAAIVQPNWNPAR